MPNKDHQAVTSWQRPQCRAQDVAAPTARDGICRALKGSFGSVPAMPEEFVRLLDRMH